MELETKTVGYENKTVYYRKITVYKTCLPGVVPYMNFLVSNQTCLYLQPFSHLKCKAGPSNEATVTIKITLILYLWYFNNIFIKQGSKVILMLLSHPGLGFLGGFKTALRGQEQEWAKKGA